MELQLARLDNEYHNRVPDWLGADPQFEAMLLPDGLVATRRSRTAEVMEASRRADGSFPEGALAAAVDAYEYSLYSSDGKLLGSEYGLAELFFTYAGVPLPQGEGSMTEHGYFVFSTDGNLQAKVYDYQLREVADGWMQGRDSHPFSWIKPDKLRLMYQAQQAAE